MANQIVLFLLSALFAGVSVCCFVEYHRRRNREKKAVYQPKYMLWVGVLCSTVFLGFAWIAGMQEESVGITVCFGVFVFLGILLMLGWKNCYITYDKEGFTQKNLISMQRSFTYDQVQAWYCNKRNPAESVLYAAGKKASFNLLSEKGPDFLVTASAGYRSTHGNQNMPEALALEKEDGGFRAHVYNPGEFLFVFILLVVFIVGMGAWMVIDSLIPIDEKDGEHYSLTFSSWEIDEDSVRLFSGQKEESFVIGGYEEYLSGMNRMIEKCDGNTMFSVYAERFDPEDADAYFRVYAISSGYEVYRSFEDSSAYKRREIPMTITIFSIFLMVWLAFSAFVYIVGSNPRRFPKWVVYGLFKKNAIEID